MGRKSKTIIRSLIFTVLFILSIITCFLFGETSSFNQKIIIWVIIFIFYFILSLILELVLKDKTFPKEFLNLLVIIEGIHELALGKDFKKHYSVIIYKYNKKRNILEPIEELSDPHSKGRNVEWAPGQGAVGLAFKHKTMIVADLEETPNDSSDWNIPPHIRLQLSDSTKAVIAIPLSLKNRDVFGVFSLSSKKSLMRLKGKNEQQTERLLTVSSIIERLLRVKYE